MKNLTRRRKIIYSVMAVVFLMVVWYGYQCASKGICGSAAIGQITHRTKKIIAPRGIVYAEVVDTPGSRAQGLSDREGLSKDEGMLFVFDVPGRYGFWMKDMLFPLDIVWMNKDGLVVHIERDVAPETYTEHPDDPQTFINGPDASYVLEINAGAAETYGLYLGTKIKME